MDANIELNENVNAYKKMRNTFRRILKLDWKIFPPDGAFYIYVDI